MLNLLFCLNVTLCFQSLCTEYGSACCTADRVVRQTDELPVVNGVLSQTADGNAHAVLIVDIESYLGTIVLLHVAG